MPDKGIFDQHNPDGVRCEEWEAWLTEMLDGELPPDVEQDFAAHGRDCPLCAELLARARQGREWLQFLQEEPFVPPGLLGRILDQTTGPGSVALPVAAVPAMAGAAVWHVSVRRGFQETRLLMTLAMAFFSITLTLNLLGVHPGSMRLQDLSLSTLESSVVRTFYGTKEQVVHTYDNLRFVYQMESRMREIRRETAPQPEPRKSKTGSQLMPPSVQDNKGQLGGATHPQQAGIEQEPTAGLANRLERKERGLA
jgi:hypothetical protein